jgi:hyperpolarization activated cyclic nucleotide-gated potassium channel 2
MNTVGYGDLSPQTPTERLCGVFFLLVACGVFSFTMNTIGSALQSVADRKHENRYPFPSILCSTKMSKVTHWLQNIDISKQLQ